MDITELRQPSPGSNPRGVPVEGIDRLQAAMTDGTPRQYCSSLMPSELKKLRAGGLAARGVVYGSAIFHIDIPYGGYFHNQELSATSRALAQARRSAYDRLLEEARRLDADGVINVQCTIRSLEWADTTLECIAQGDAVVFSSNAAPALIDKAPFTTTFGPEECLELFDAQLRPLQIVFGNCVYHIAHQGFLQSLRQTGTNAELGNYSLAIAGARELAIGRLENEAATLEASGVLGLTTSESNHGWRSHIVEYFAVGNAVIATDEVTEFRKENFKH